jgi:hypothetical protein
MAAVRGQFGLLGRVEPEILQISGAIFGASGTGKTSCRISWSVGFARSNVCPLVSMVSGH